VLICLRVRRFFCADGGRAVDREAREQLDWT
jgi:hypothetical protein